MKCFAIFPNLIKPHAMPIAMQIRDFLLQKRAKVVAEDEKAAALNVPPLSSIPPNQIDFLISIGGDGTILRMVHLHPEIEAPIIGINLGSLGFMADIPIEEIYICLEDVLGNHFTIHERIVMDGSAGGKKCFAVNEIVIHRVQNPCLIDLNIHVDGVYLNTFSADGLIISTPNGSTAYSLAAGGPIITPDLKVLAVTPICPHTISNRPLVIGADKEIVIEYSSEYEPIEVTYDGFPLQKIASSESVVIRPSHRKFKMVAFDRLDFFSTLRKKLGWGGKI